MQEIYLLTFVIGLAAGLAIIVKKLHQPILVSYVAAGALLSAFHIVKPEQLEFLAILPEIGLALLLFLVGMELDLKEFKSLGRRVVMATGIQVLFTTAIFTGIFTQLGMSLFGAIIVAISVSFSSTILVIKLLLEKKELGSLHGKLAVGILLVEDLIAVVALMLLAVMAQGEQLSFVSVGILIAKGGGLLVASLFIGHRILPRIFKSAADNSELLFLSAIAWCMVFVSVSVALGFSLAIGAFLAGVSLAQSVYRVQISGRVKPLRDFFIMIFFLDLGIGLSISGVQAHLPLAIGLIAYAVIIKPLLFFLVFTVTKFRAHPAFQTGIVISSISEFSLILVAAGVKGGIVSEEYLSPLIFATVFSFVISSIIVSRSRGVYLGLRKVLKWFERRRSIGVDVGEENLTLENHAVLIGAHRSGGIILKKLERLFDKNMIVVDFNPEIVEKLTKEGKNVLFGDILDPEIYEKAGLAKAKLVVSTIREIGDNISLLELLTREKSEAVAVITAADREEAMKLYEKGAHYVSMPTDLEGINISHILPMEVKDLEKMKKERVEKMDELEKQP